MKRYHQFKLKMAICAVTILSSLLWHLTACADNPQPEQPCVADGAPQTGIGIGGLIVPFKFELSGKSFSGSMDEGGYLGDTQCIPPSVVVGPKPIFITPLFFVGATNVGLNNTQPGEQSSGGSQEALSLGFGAVLATYNNVQAGVVMGWDLTTKSYPDAGMPWISVDFGYKFLQ